MYVTVHQLKLTGSKGLFAHVCPDSEPVFEGGSRGVVEGDGGGKGERQEGGGGVRLVKGGSGEMVEEDEDEEEEKFFDAHEISAEDWAKSTKAEFLGDEESPAASSEGDVTAEKPPFNSGRSMEEVSSSCSDSLFNSPLLYLPVCPIAHRSPSLPPSLSLPPPPSLPPSLPPTLLHSSSLPPTLPPSFLPPPSLLPLPPSQAFYKTAPSFFEKVEVTLSVRRTTILPRPNVRFNLWSFIKNSVGKDLTKLPMPVSQLYICTTSWSRYIQYY